MNRRNLLLRQQTLEGTDKDSVEHVLEVALQKPPRRMTVPSSYTHRTRQRA